MKMNFFVIIYSKKKSRKIKRRQAIITNYQKFVATQNKNEFIDV